MKLKEDNLNINIKKMALKKKRDRDARTSRAAIASTSRPNSGRLVTVPNIVTNNRAAHSNHDHLDIEQRKAWGKDLVDIATRGRIERGSTLHWTLIKTHICLIKAKG